MKRLRPVATLFLITLLASIYLYWSLHLPAGQALTARLTQSYALTAVSLLYLSVLISPLYNAFPKLPYRAIAVLLRRPFGVAAFGAASIHASLAFFGELGGFPGLPFLDSSYILAISLSSVALFILLLLALTSTDQMVKWLGRRWKLLHRLIYVAGILIVIHALLLGSSYANLSATIPTVSSFLLGTLLLLEGYRIDGWLSKRQIPLPKIGLVTAIVLALIAYSPHSFHTENGQVGGLNVHAEHQQIALENQGVDTSSLAYAGLRGDRTKRYTVSFNHESVQPNQDTQLSFEVFDAASGNPVISYATVYDKLLHLIIVDSSLQYYAHIHPIVQGNQFLITTQFPHLGRYHLYLDYQPYGAIEQQQAFTLDVGGSSDAPSSQAAVDSNQSKTFNGTSVAFTSDGPLSAARLSKGAQAVIFTLKNASTGLLRTDLTPYLSAFGHLVMINTTTYEYVHVHPSSLIVPSPGSHGGPTVEFLPLGLYGPIKAGTYRLFAQFQPANQLITTDFTVEVR